MLAMQRKLTIPFYLLLSLPSTAMGFALSVQISALSWLLTTQFGLDIHQVGLVWAAGPIAGILGQVFIGIISDKVWFWQGRRRPFILIGGTLAGMMLLALPNIDIVSTSLGFSGLLGVAIAVALTLDLSINISFNPTRSIIADVTPSGAERTRGYTWMQTVSGSFGVLAYAIGATWGNFILIYVGAVLVFCLSIIPPFFIKEPKELVVNDIESANEKVSITKVLMNIKPLWGFILYDVYAIALQLSGVKTSHYWAEIIAVIVTLFFVIDTLIRKENHQDRKINDGIGFRKILAAHSFSWIGVQTMFVFIFAFLQEKMPLLTDDELGKVIATSFLILSAVSALLPAFVLTPLAKRFGRVNVHTACIASMAVCYALVAFLGMDKYLLFVLMALLGFGWAAIISLPFAIMSEKVEQSKMGLFMGLFNLSVVLPQLLVSLGVGLFINNMPDKSLVFQISAVALAISAIAWTQIDDAQHKVK
ncbi:MFS transporter [Thalassotalea piscium]